MKKILMVFSIFAMALTFLFIIPGEVGAETIQVPLVPASTPIQIRAGDTLTFNRTTNAYNDISYTEYFRNDPSEPTIWGFSSTGNGHYVRYNGTNFRMEGGTWNGHVFMEAYSDEWIDWSYVGNVGTLTFLQDWPTEIVGLYSSTAMTTPKSSWNNTTNISVYATLNLTDPIIPGETTTPPNGVVLIGSFYDGLIYYNLWEDYPGTTTRAYYISTHDGIGFDLNILTETLQFELNNPDVRFGIYYNNPEGYPMDIIFKEPQIELSILDDKLIVNGYSHTSGNPVNYEIIRSNFLYMYVVVPLEPATINFYDGVTLLDTDEVDIGDTITKPVDPVKEGFFFLGWELDTEYRWNFTTDTVTDTEVNLYAVFVPDTTIVVHTITFETNEGSLIDNLLVVDGELAETPTSPTKTGYVFGGWYTDEELTIPFSFTVTIDESLTLYAKWTASGGGTVTPPAETSLSTLQIVGLLVVGVVGIAWFTSKKKKG